MRFHPKITSIHYKALHVCKQIKLLEESLWRSYCFTNSKIYLRFINTETKQEKFMKITHN